MLLSITERCNGGCPHCMLSATADGLDMTEETFAKAMVLLGRLEVHVVIFSGGEPTLHPLWDQYLEHLIKAGLIPLVTTNGTFLRDPQKTATMRHLIGKYKMGVQITADPRYYRDAEETVELAHAAGFDTVETHIQRLLPLGRGRTYGKGQGHNGYPTCLNRWLVAKQLPVSMEMLVDQLEQAGKFCSPSIWPDGSVRPTDHNTCTPIGTVDSEPWGLMTTLVKGQPCGRCGMTNMPRGALEVLARVG